MLTTNDKLIAKKITATEKLALETRRADALFYMEVALGQLALRETLCREEIVHFTKLLMTYVEGAK